MDGMILTEEPEAPKGLGTEWAEFLNMRRKKGKGHYPTPYAQTLLIKKLSQLSGGNLELQRYIINRSTERNWDGLFLDDRALDEFRQSQPKKPHQHEVAI